MNEEMILQMVEPYVKDSALTYDQFDNLFLFLNLKEQYMVVDVLYQNGINLIDKQETEINVDTLENQMLQEFEILYDETVFLDSEEDDKEILFINDHIKQSNEILCQLIQQGNLQSRQDICVKNRRLVDKYAMLYQKRYANRLDFDDLEQAGFIGLTKAAEKFDSSKETSFSTYAVYWIRQSIVREIMDNGFAIRIPVHMMERINKVMYWDNLLEYEGMNFSERIKKISEELCLSEDEVKECLILKNNYLTYASLNSPVGEEEESELGEFIPIDEIMGTEKIVEKHFLHEALEKAIMILDSKEQDILRLRFGFDIKRSYTLQEIGEKYGVTRERIRQIENKAINKLKNPAHARMIRDFLYDD